MSVGKYILTINCVFISSFLMGGSSHYLIFLSTHSFSQALEILFLLQSHRNPVCHHIQMTCLWVPSWPTGTAHRFCPQHSLSWFYSTSLTGFFSASWRLLLSLLRALLLVYHTHSCHPRWLKSDCIPSPPSQPLAYLPSPLIPQPLLQLYWPWPHGLPPLTPFPPATMCNHSRVSSVAPRHPDR